MVLTENEGLRKAFPFGVFMWMYFCNCSALQTVNCEVIRTRGNPWKVNEIQGSLPRPSENFEVANLW